MTSSLGYVKSLDFGLLHQTPSYLDAHTNRVTQEALAQISAGKIPVFGEWLLSSFSGDAVNYLKMSMGQSSIEPYSLRIFYPKLVGSVAKGLVVEFGLEEKAFSVYSATFMVLNYLCFFFSVILSFKLLRSFAMNEFVALCLSFLPFLPFLQFGYLKILQAPMVDAPAVLFSLLFLFLLKENKVLSATLVSIFMVLTKDSLIIFAVVPLILFLMSKKTLLLFPLLTMPAVFVGLRVFSEVDPLSMQYGWAVSKGDIRWYYFIWHFGSLGRFINWLIGLWYSFGPFLLLLMLGLRSSTNQQLKSLTYILLLTSLLFLLAQVMLASRVERTLTPISIPVVLFSLLLIYDWYEQGVVKLSSSIGLRPTPRSQ